MSLTFRYIHQGASTTTTTTTTTRKPTKEKPKTSPVKPKVEAVTSDLTCERCNKTLANLNSLAVHRQLHYGLKPFKCDFCCTRFTQKCNMKRHLRTCKGAIEHSENCSKATTSHGGRQATSSSRHENSARITEPSSPVF